MLRAATPASVIPPRSPARGSVVDAAVAIAGSGTGRTLIEPVEDDDAHDTTDNAPAVSDNDAAVHRVKRRPVLGTLFISAFSP
jgi:hypothetical protein